jgi:hypothetical protein
MRNEDLMSLSPGFSDPGTVQNWRDSHYPARTDHAQALAAWRVPTHRPDEEVPRREIRSIDEMIAIRLY